MTETQSELVLSPGENYLTRDPDLICRLQQGTVQVSIVYRHNDTLSEPLFYCTVSETDRQRTIPSLCWEDRQHRTWLLSLRAGDTGAVFSLTGKAPTTVPYQNFLRRRNIPSFDTMGFERSLAYFYNQQYPITLSRTDSFLARSRWEAYRLETGHIYVYIAPMERDRPGKSVFYCEIKDTDPDRSLPALFFRDQERRRWRLLIRPVGEEAELSLVPGGVTEPLQKSFLKRRGITSYDQEGFERSLVEFYTKQVVVKDKGFIQKASSSGAASRQKVVRVLKDTFSENGQTEYSGNPSYQALQFICSQTDIPLIRAEELSLRCGKNPTVAEIARASHFICRKVVLDADWHRCDCGPLVSTIDKEIVACMPDKSGVYQVFRTGNSSITPLTPELAREISPQAWSIGRTLPLKSLTKKDVFRFCAKSIRPGDLIPYGVLAVFCALIGVLLPSLNRLIYDEYIPVGNLGSMTELCVVMLTFMFGNLSFSIVKNLFSYRITSRVGNELQNAVYHRLFHLPESFFRSYESADLAGRISSIGKTANSYADAIVICGISSLFSLVYLIRMISYNSKLTWFSMGVYLIYLVFVVAITSTVHRGQVRIAEAESESSSKLYQYLSGVDKIRMAGVEDRALLSFMRPYARQQTEMIRVNRLVSVEEALSTVIGSVFSMVMYAYIIKKLESGSISVGTFVAFNSAFGAFTGSLNSLLDKALALYQERGEIKRFWPVFETVPEDDDSKDIPGALSGGLTLEHVTFAYDKDAKKVLRDLSIDIRPGEYVGIVGPSGCGKSTLLKLLLGFETPQSGMVTVDKKDLRSLNKGAYRRQLGVVLQNGRLISGTIYENITITAPDATMARVNEVVQQVGLKEDIAQMPMGLHTMLSENSNTISGGQQQRILIARAICGNPRILIFDEATSALDNMTQAAVSSSLDAMNVTRIVVAHRLSTIKNCDRILVLNEGRVVQEGTYDSLMEDTGGLFHALASRQIAQ